MRNILVLHASTVMGGAEYSLLELLHNLGNPPVSLHMACDPGHVLYRYAKSFPIHCHDISLPYLKRKHPAIFRIPVILSTSVRLCRLVYCKNIHIVYCNTFRALPYCLVIKILCRTRLVCHCRDHLPSRYVRFMLRRVVDEFIAVSKSLCPELPQKSKIHIIHNGVNLSLFSTDSSNFLHRKYRLPSHIQLIGNIGQILPWKNQADYLTVAELLLRHNKNLHFFMIGSVMDNDYHNLLRQQIRLLQLEPYITFTGQVENIADYMSCFTVVLHTAHDEPFGRVLIEAAASARPVIAYSSGGPSEIIKTGKTGYLVKDGDTETMSEFTNRLLTNPGLCEYMGNSAREHVADNFNSADYARKVCKILLHD